MIFPFLRGLVWPKLAPFTYLLLAINLLVFGVTYSDYERLDSAMDEILTDEVYLKTQGLIFAEMVAHDPRHYSSPLRELSLKVFSGDRDTALVLGNLAARNTLFMKTAADFAFEGDEIAHEDWKAKFEILKAEQNEHPSYVWGISFLRNGWAQYLTYQFAHGGFAHLFWNMVFLLFFGCFLEVQLGSFFVVATYVGGGVVGALTFSQLSGISAAPLVGASGAVTALMALVGFGWIKKTPVRFFYWLLPFEGYFGFIALPSWLVLLVSLLPDLSGYLSSSEDFGSVAYAAHIGGALWGLLLAVLWRTNVLKPEVEAPPAQDLPNPFAADARPRSGRRAS